MKIIFTDAIAQLSKEGIEITGWLPKTATLRGEWYLDNTHPQVAVEVIKNESIKADIYTFVERPPVNKPSFDYHCEWEEMAAIHVESFDKWWNEQIPKSSRKHIRRSAKRGLSIRVVPFTDELVRGIKEMYDEHPLRGGTPFPHYKTSFEALKASHGTFLDQTDFIGAFVEDEMAGFIKLTYAGQTARTMQIFSKRAHSDKWPTNALIAEAVKICEKKNIPYLIFGKLNYGKIGSPGLSSFKRENGFTSKMIPRYYVPLTLRGKIALKLNLHLGYLNVLPKNLLVILRNLRGKYYRWKFS